MDLISMDSKRCSYGGFEVGLRRMEGGWVLEGAGSLTTLGIAGREAEVGKL